VQECACLFDGKQEGKEDQQRRDNCMERSDWALEESRKQLTTRMSKRTKCETPEYVDPTPFRSF
jgi:hypothetical protein